MITNLAKLPSFLISVTLSPLYFSDLRVITASHVTIQSPVTRWWIVEFFSSYLLEGKNSVETLDRVKAAADFFISQSEMKIYFRDKTELTHRVGSSPQDLLLCFFMWFIWFPPSHFVMLTPSFGSTLVPPLQPSSQVCVVIFPMST